jgi:ferredoxin
MEKDLLSSIFIDRSGLATIFDHLKSQGYQNVGNIYRDGALMIEKVDHFEQLASGFHEEIGKGHYRAHQRDNASLFEYTVGPSTFKKFLNPPKRKLWSSHKTATGFEIVPESPNVPKYAFWGIRSCELKAIDILDRVFLKGDYVNPWYKKAKEQLITISATCLSPSANCFCTTTHTGPKARQGYDLNLTEILEDSKTPIYLGEVGSKAMEKIVQKLRFKKANKEVIAREETLVEKVTSEMKLRFQPQDARQSLKNNLEHPHWEAVAERCLSCANCTMVCPTCFCTTVEDITDITGDHTERWAKWDSCFNSDFSYIHGGKIRNSKRSRYRQWLTHKFSSWYDQYGTSGCVGCGRCITWCPVGIDLTEEFNKIKTAES